MVCNEVTGSDIVLKDEIVTLMTDNGNGTYTYTSSFSDIGQITISVMLKVVSGVDETFYDTTTVGTGTAYTSTFR